MKNQAALMNMIKQQLRTNNIHNEAILKLFEQIPRDAFVPKSLSAVAYCDVHLPLGHDQCMMTPLEEATILQSLNLQGHETVLEIGTGSGFFTTLLSHLCHEVISIEYYEAFTQQAKQPIHTFAKKNVTLQTGNAAQGWLDKAPYDVIVYTGGLETLSEMQKLQVAPHGKLFAVLGQGPVMQGQLFHLKADDAWDTTPIFTTEIPMLIGSKKSKAEQTFIF